MSPRTGVTLVELLLVAACIGCGVAVAINVGTRFGMPGYLGGFVAGSIGAFAAFIVFGYTVAFVIGVLAGNPEYPVCSNGTCQSREPPDSNYRYEDVGGLLVARCKCGIAYVKKGRRVRRLQPDGSQTPYMIWKPLRGWFVDESEGI